MILNSPMAFGVTNSLACTCLGQIWRSLNSVNWLVDSGVGEAETTGGSSPPGFHCLPQFLESSHKVALVSFFIFIPFVCKNYPHRFGMHFDWQNLLDFAQIRKSGRPAQALKKCDSELQCDSNSTFIHIGPGYPLPSCSFHEPMFPNKDDDFEQTKYYLAHENLFVSFL